MFKVTKHKLMVATIFSFVLLSPYPIRSTTAYLKTWTQSNGSKLRITISPDSTNLQVKRTHSYKMVLEVIAFGTNQEGFYSMATRFRFVNSNYTIESDLIGDIGELSSVGSKKQIGIQLTIPSATKFSLELGESIQGQLQYLVYYSEQQKDWDKSEMAPNQWPHENDKIIGWDTISQGTINNPFYDLPSIGIIAIIAGSLISSIIIFGDIYRKRSVN